MLAKAKAERADEPQAYSRAQAAGVEAGRAYESSTPAPLWDGQETEVRRFAAAPSSPLRRVGALVRGVIA